jgi:hypothetical protein
MSLGVSHHQPPGASVRTSSTGRLLAGGAILLTVACHERRAAESRPYPDAPAVAAAPCPLGGVWEVRLAHRSDSSHRTTGWIAISDSTGPRFSPPGGGNDAALWRGRYQIPLEPLFRPGEGGVPSMSVQEGATADDIRSGVLALVLPPGDSVAIGLSPPITHGPLSLFGRLRGDSVIGRWVQRTYGSTVPDGPVVMIRREGCAKP